MNKKVLYYGAVLFGVYMCSKWVITDKETQDTITKVMDVILAALTMTLLCEMTCRQTKPWPRPKVVVTQPEEVKKDEEGSPFSLKKSKSCPQLFSSAISSKKNADPSQRLKL